LGRAQPPKQLRQHDRERRRMIAAVDRLTVPTIGPRPAPVQPRLPIALADPLDHEPTVPPTGIRTDDLGLDRRTPAVDDEHEHAALVSRVAPTRRRRLLPCAAPMHVVDESTVRAWFHAGENLEQLTGALGSHRPSAEYMQDVLGL